MKKICFLFYTLSFFSFAMGQEYLPSYPSVLRNFFLNYSGGDDYENFVNFAKKKKGWYVQHINRLRQDSLLNEALFWSVETKFYLNISDKYEKQYDKEDGEKKIGEYLNGQAAYLWNDYERCRYHGYGGWESDLIHDFIDQPVLQDTLLEGIARAYSSLCNTFLWYQQGGTGIRMDTMQVKLQPLQMPSEARANKVNSLIKKSLETYDRLIKQNPTYKVLVGNIRLKKFNEMLFGYMQLSMAMQDEKAMAFIKNAELAEPYIKQAKNYLNSCDKNAILFTFGDNDTYQLWYVQEKENFRKDVSVINISMLCLAAYVDMIRRKHLVSFTANPSFYGSVESDVTYFEEKENTDALPPTTLEDCLKNIFSRKQTKTVELSGKQLQASTYATKSVNLQFNNKEFNAISPFRTVNDGIFFELKEYLYLNDLLELDIINENINRRPIYFTTSSPGFFEENLVQQGIVFRLFPLTNMNKDATSKKEIIALEKFTDSIYQPVISFDVDGTRNFSYDGNNTFFQLFSKLADHYTEQGELKKAADWLRKGSIILKEISKENMPGGLSFANSYMKINKEIAKKYYEKYSLYLYDKYAQPDALKGYLSKEECLQKITALVNYLKQENIESATFNTILKNLK